jgi:hypothetical protein
MKDWFGMWFGLRAPVTRSAYVAGGVLFMLVKFAIERAIFAALVHKELSPVAFLSPFFRDRAEILRGAPDGVTWALIGVALPFLWLGISMSVRRALDAGLPPLVGFLFLIPGVNYLLMAVLSVWPSRKTAPLDASSGAYRPAPEQVHLAPEAPSARLRAVRAILASSAVGFGMFGICVYVLRSYGSALFLATPLAMGAVAATAYGSAKSASPKYHAPATAIGCGLLGLAVVGVGLLMASQEGLGCIAMAVVPAGVMAVLGSLLAITLSSLGETAKTPWTAAFLLPLAAGVESAATPVPLHEVVTSVVVNAPPDVVWKNVVAFPDLAPPTEWIFQHGVSYPLRAHIVGEGVGAVRYCEFSTGDFVEPITRWEPGQRLSFDVAESPEPMREWSFWDHVDAPHLHGFMRSKRGEFRLVPLEGGKTLLEGSTFYELEIYPELYWKAWTDGILHTVHRRVLDHIARISEATRTDG